MIESPDQELQRAVGGYFENHDRLLGILYNHNSLLLLHESHRVFLVWWSIEVERQTLG